MDSFQMAPLWQHMTHLTGWFDRIAARPAWTSAVVDWGDVTTKTRTEHGQAAFETVERLWNA